MRNRKQLIAILAGIMAAVMLLGLVAMIVPRANAAASSSEIKKQINELKGQKSELQDQIDALEDLVNENMSEMEKIVAEKDAIDQQIALMYQQIENVDSQIQAFGLLIADKQEELEAAQAHQAELTAQNKERIRAMEEQGEINYWSVLFKASSFSDLLDRLNMIHEIQRSDKRRMAEMTAAAEKVAAAQAELETEKAALEDTKAELKVMQTDMETKRAASDALLVELNAKGEEFAAQIEAGEDEIEGLLSEIAKKEKEYDQAKDREYKQWLSTSVPPTTKPKPNTGSSSTSPKPPANVVAGIKWVMPCKYTYLSSPYGYRVHPVYGTWKFHSGVDLAAPKGTPIYASRSGTVTAATYHSSMGNYVTINHGDGFSTSYLHMTHDTVSKGQHVSAGQVIGYVGSTGVSTGPHLHFTVYYKGETVNPADYFNF
ncbi:MAG: peptidoglycan DD-metalloendopeptidase family protein [Oscillospiraceae bacterium]|nr:peptidoglycan DD-metalloendopeptidase family protein [Oscillospiraceae bacterium]